MKFFKKASGILGMNARNLNYVSKYNSSANKKFANDKIFSKHFLESRGIGVAKLYHVLSAQRQLTPEFFKALPDSFVIKPNRGFGGSGIFVILEKKGKYWITADGKKLDKDFIFRHCVAILDGKYSISGIHDQVIFEEVLEKHTDFRKLSDIGLPDIRIIVFNLIPIIAMMRVPTYESEGKANMELGAIGVGIDIGTGKTTRGAYHSKVVSKMPNGYPIKDFQIPFWDEILLTASKIQNVSKIGYLGVDIVVTKTGVKVLETNSLSGLKIQIANKIPLKKRLEKVHDLKVLNPEDGVEIAKTLFSQNHPTNEEVVPEKPIIGATESVILNCEPPRTLKAKIDLSLKENIINKDYYNGSILDISIKGKRLKLPVSKGKTGDADMLLAGKFLSDFYIDPNKEIKNINPHILTSQLDEKKIINIDEKICEIDKRIHLLAYLNPQNLSEQKSLFIENPEFSPKFYYRELDIDINQMRRDLKRIPEIAHPLFPLFLKKIEEIEYKLDLIQSTGTPDFQKATNRLFGEVGETTYRSALKFLQKHLNSNIPDESPELDTKEAIERIKKFLKEYKLSHWGIKILTESVSDIQVTKRNAILVRKGATFKENRLKALLVHEIGTHIFRFENGKLQPFRIFERGTAEYLKTEEGLAIWNQNQLGLSLGDKFLSPAFQILAIYLGKKMSFCDLFHFLQDTYQLPDEFAWKLCVKAKRGLTDTSVKQAFTKDAVYFKGNQEIGRFIKDGGNIQDLYIGKIAVKDLPIVKKIDGMVEPKFLL